MSDTEWSETADMRPPSSDPEPEVHPSRLALERLLVDPSSSAAWRHLAHAYDAMSAEWDDWVRTQPWYVTPVVEALSRTRPPAFVVEVGCGSGQLSTILADFAGRAICTDVNLSMLQLAPRVRNTIYAVADVRFLPFRTMSVPFLVGLNAVPCLPEFNRVVALGGHLLWCTSRGVDTPLYVEPARFMQLAGSSWRGESGTAGSGEWLLLTKERQAPENLSHELDG
jgi:SAM-dependent methyltransferase